MLMTERTHFKIGSRKSPLAMVQSEFVVTQLQKIFPNFAFEIVNFETKGDRLLDVSLPKIGGKGLFTKELEDALENETIDFVVHSLKDLPCQSMSDKLILSGVLEREDPSDALVVAKRWQDTKKRLDDFEENSVIGTSSVRRISQLKLKFPHLKFETIRGNLQTRLAKLDDDAEKKYDAIILATAGLKRMGYADRITQIFSFKICMHAVSQGALGIQSRSNDFLVIQMINQLNHEETLLRCIAERTLLAQLEGGCNAPVGVVSKVTENSIVLEVVVLSICSTQKIYDKFEMKFDGLMEFECPIISIMNDEILSKKNENKNCEASDLEKLDTERPILKTKNFSYIVDLNIAQNKMLKAELCGFHLAQKLKDKGADLIIKECKVKLINND